MDHIIFELVIHHTKIDVATLSILSCIDKNTHTTVKHFLEFIRKNYDKQQIYSNGKELKYSSASIKNPCSICQTNTYIINPFTNNYTCKKCTKTISKTDSKNNYNLTDKDLGNLNYYMSYIGIYRVYATFYYKKDVIGLAVLKHGSPSIQIKKPKGKSNAMKKRIEQLDKALNKVIPIKDHQWITQLDICRNFLKNGSDGINTLKTKFKQYNDFHDFIHKELSEIQRSIIQYEFKNYFNDFTIDQQNTKNNIIQYCNRKEQSEIRRLKLTTELEKHGLILRSDSELCDQYIEGSIDDIENVVYIMQQMNFLFKYTNYSSIIKNKLNIAYERAKANIYDNYGYIEDPEEYEELLHEYIDRDLIYHQAKCEAMKHCIKDIPNYMQEFV